MVDFYGNCLAVCNLLKGKGYDFSFYDPFSSILYTHDKIVSNKMAFLHYTLKK